MVTMCKFKIQVSGIQGWMKPLPDTGTTARTLMSIPPREPHNRDHISRVQLKPDESHVPGNESLHIASCTW